ncbi:hydroxymethylglutaryl-coenzyme A reductase-domain-containing protein [Aspergillus crustosus]
MPLATKSFSFRRRIVLSTQRLSSLASAHPVHTVVLVSLLVSSIYVSLLENSLLGASSGHDYTISSFGKSSQLYAGPETAWEWQSKRLHCLSATKADHRAIVNLHFDQYSSPPPSVALPEHVGAEQLPPSLDTSSPSSGHSLTFSVHHSQVTDFLSSIHEIPIQRPLDGYDSQEEISGDKWVQSQSQKARRGLSGLALDKWTELLYLFNHAAPLDIAVMAAAYISMHLTFGSLFVTMYRLGSRFWLFTGVICSSTFAFLFALFATTKFGSSPNLAMLSEGLPFLVVTVGFENPVRLTRAVLSHAEKAASPTARQTGNDPSGESSPSIIQRAIATSIEQEGPSIVKHYALEITVLSLGAFFAVDSALRQFCFLAAWILFFDCVFLFTVYVAILCIKLEIIRIQSSGAQHSPKAREDVSMTVFGNRVTRSQISKFKLGMIAAFILVNVLNMSMIPFRAATATSPPSLPLGMSIHSRDISLPISSLDVILNKAIAKNQPMIVTILPPIRYQLQSSVDSAQYTQILDEDQDDISGYGMSSLLQSLEDPVLSKCVIVALIISVALNGRLFAAARSGVKDPETRDERIPEQQSEATQPPANEVEVTQYPQDPPSSSVTRQVRSRAESQQLLQEGRALELADEEIVALSLSGKLPLHALEKTLKDFTRAVKVRRSIVSRTNATSGLTHTLEASDLPYEQYDWSRVFGVCCENVVGFMPVPVGLAGPLTIDKKSYFLPMATTEGVLVAGVMRGSKAINAGGGIQTVLTADGMTRGPCVTFDSLGRTAAAKEWLDSTAGQTIMKKAFDSTTRYGRLQSIKTAMAGTNLYIRFKATTGDAMGMNMISKGVEHALHTMHNSGFTDMNIISLSANYCSDKKPAAINWIDGRGKSVVAQATIPAEIVQSVLKTDVDAMVALNTDKNLIGSAMAGSIGGFNAHAANIVAAMYIATGQDPAQVVESANCITIMKKYVSHSSPLRVNSLRHHLILILSTYLASAAPSKSPSPCPQSKSAP